MILTGQLNSIEATLICGGIALRQKNFAYMLYHDGEEELCDMRKDPKQFINPVANPEYSSVLEQMQEELDDRITADGIMFGKEKRNSRHRIPPIASMRILQQRREDCIADKQGFIG